MGKLTRKGKHTVKVRNHPHTNRISKPIIVRGREYKCRIFEIKSSETENNRVCIYMCVCVCILLYQNLMVTTNQKCIIDIHTHKKKESKYNSPQSHQITREEENGGKEEKDLQTQTQNN